MAPWTSSQTFFDVMVSQTDLVSRGAWQILTRSDSGLPWEDGHVPTTWLEGHQPKLAKVRSFVSRYKAISTEMAKRDALRTKADSDSEGRTAVLGWIDRQQKTKWDVRARILDVLEEYDYSPYQCMRTLGAKELGTADECAVYTVTSQIVGELFGDDAVRNGTHPEPWAHSAVRRLIQIMWKTERTRIKREINSLEAFAEKVNEKWEAVQSKKNFNVAVKAYAKQLAEKVELVKKIDNPLVTPNWKGHIEKVERICEQLADRSQAVKGLPKTVIEAIQQLATEEEVQELQLSISQLLEKVDPDQDEEFAFAGSNIANEGWNSGVEHYQQCTLDEVWAMLGRGTEKTIPFFNTVEATESGADPWSVQGILALQDGPTQPLVPHWHQLVGILKMLDNFLAGKPILLVDGVGVGKTMQVVGVICFLAFFHDHFERNGYFPGKYKTTTFKGNGNVPNAPHLIVVPVSLEYQFRLEIHRYYTPFT
ncbi:uncharacterized protein C8Q71DRAFT_863615 [Rhodofomes roseus]|uniref:SNF2 N-terminal domain-containing protein n=1 Tax=Rhodofomes roseus TaxID=34475 RepID=A0ABQ8JXL1_9APHY|nr:uncharacterized protein C8Q71DRAFT_863615 [Rhodofomes roseus]KAH9828935.1 hypothetical protein C8Q71DRAFT_863615 [Rhodofomes roseus]